MIHREIVLREVGVGASEPLTSAEDLTSIQFLIDQVRAGTATTQDADNAAAAVISLETNGVPVLPAPPAKTFSWQNIMLGFSAGIVTASIAYLAMNPKPARRAQRRSRPRNERTTVRPRFARA